MADKNYTSVSSMLDAISDGDSFASEVKDRISQRKIIKTLQAMRIAKCISQDQIAGHLKCSQSRISKLEKGPDSSLRLDEIEAYARALDCDVNMVFSRRNETAVDRVKRHAFAIKEELECLAECAKGDEAIASAVGVFFGEAFFNIVKMIQDASLKLPVREEDGEPHIRITAVIDESDKSEQSDCFDEVGESQQPRRTRLSNAEPSPITF